MALTFNDAAVRALLDNLASAAETLGVFDGGVIRHEPKNAPAVLPACAVWWESIRPARSSGLASVSAVVILRGRVYQARMLAEPQDSIDPGLLGSTAKLLSAWSGQFTLGGTVRAVDLLGAEGQALEAVSGFIMHDSVLLRVAEITIPVIINDAWDEVA